MHAPGNRVRVDVCDQLVEFERSIGARETVDPWWGEGNGEGREELPRVLDHCRTWRLIGRLNIHQGHDDGDVSDGGDRCAQLRLLATCD